MHNKIFDTIKCLWVMVFSATFNNILVISLWSLLLMEEAGVPGENHRPAETLAPLSTQDTRRRQRRKKRRKNPTIQKTKKR